MMLSRIFRTVFWSLRKGSAARKFMVYIFFPAMAGRFSLSCMKTDGKIKYSSLSEMEDPFREKNKTQLMMNQRKPRAYRGVRVPRHWGCFVAACLLLILTAGQTARAGPHGYPVFRQAGTGSLEGTITDSLTGDPITGAIITLEPGDAATFTFGDGHYRFNELTQGIYRATVTAAGYTSASSTVRIQSGRTTELNFALNPPGSGWTLRGMVVDRGTGNGVEGARIDVDPDGLLAYTNSSGRYTINGRESGRHTLTVSHEDYFSATRTDVLLSTGDILEENFILYRELGRIGGRVLDAETRKRIGGATVRSEDGQFSTTTSAGGIYLLNNIPPGLYTLIFEAPNYRSVRRTNVRVELSGLMVVSVVMQPNRPQVLEATADPQEIPIPETAALPDDPAFSILLTASVVDPDGPEDILYVLVDLTPIGGSRIQRMYDDGTHGDQTARDGVYSVRTAATPDTAVGEAALTVTAADTRGALGRAEISIHAYLQRQETLPPMQTDVYAFQNRIPGQTLIISYQLLPDAAGAPDPEGIDLRAFPDTDQPKKIGQPPGDAPPAPRRQEACVTYIEIEGPDGTVLGPFTLTETPAETEIPNGEAGQWTYRVTTQCPEAQSYNSSARGSGTGLIVGMVRDSVQQTGIDGALIQSDLGVAAISTEGRYLMIAPAGVSNLQATAFGHADTTAADITIQAGETKEVNMDMVPLLTLSPNQSTYIAGSSLGLDMQNFYPDGTRQVDAYFLILLPDGQTFITFDEYLVPYAHTLGDGAPLESIGRNLPFTTTSLQADDFYTFTGIEPTGEYGIYIILTDPGGNPENAGDWVAWAECRFVYQ
ncbi:MAG: carboxypeptidase regulatory-like domain-containing protein [Deltaproteobacteria bacterium]|nr:carboxypeptidase regulatory-like domain-containing protein [Deltaproteobacteria bacterium]